MHIPISCDHVFTGVWKYPSRKISSEKSLLGKVYPGKMPLGKWSHGKKAPCQKVEG